MLQIVTGMYFRDVPLYETTHRAVLFTNAWALERGPIELPIGSFSFATSPSPVTAVTIEATERLEAVRPDGEPEFVKATGGHERIDDVADVFAFALNVSRSRNAALRAVGSGTRCRDGVRSRSSSPRWPGVLLAVAAFPGLGTPFGPYRGKAVPPIPPLGSTVSLDLAHLRG